MPVRETPATVVETGCEVVKKEVSRYKGWDANLISAIAQAENRTCDPTRHNLTNSENHGVCIGSYGVLQVGCLHYNEGENRDDLKTNVAVAHRVWLKQGYKAWSCFNNGTYKQFL